MARIALEGMKFFAFHGFYPEETILGTDYLVDVSVETGIAAAAKTDDLAKTVNYETIYQAVKMEMETRHDLLETVVENITQRLKFQFQNLAVISVSVKKLNPPLGGRVAASSVADAKTFATGCPRCKRPMICYGDETCWCQNTPKTIWPVTQANVKLQYKSCLCPTCLDFFAG
jgi:7,8-dihydroneopterin aldolase/epimerase/oxygenase